MASKRPNQPPPEQQAEWLSRYTQLKTAARSIAGQISALGNEVKNAAGPTYLKNLKRIHDLLKLDPDEAKAELENLMIQAAQQDIRIAWIGDQATFADVMEQAQPAAAQSAGARGLAAARAHSDGFNSGKNGAVPHDNPHRPGTEEYISWHDGRDEGELARQAKKPTEAARVAAAAQADAGLPDDASGPRPIF